MKLIIGLGNPGKKYENTYHNVGFLVVDHFGITRGLINDKNSFKNKSKFFAEIAEGKLKDEKIILAQPTTFMNNSGRAAKALLDFYKAEEKDLIIVHDEMDIDLGKIRISKDASAAGHNGIKSIIQYLGSQDFIRVRVGIRSEKQEQIPTEDWVLKNFNSEEITKPIKDAADAIEIILEKDLKTAMNQYN